MPKSFKLPDLGEGIHEGEVLAVLVSVGQEISEGDIILEVETDKAAVEIPSPYTGKVQDIFVKPGDVVNVGDAMMTFSNGDDAAAVATADAPAEKTVTVAPAAETAAEPPPARKDGPVPASPATRRLARELGVDLHQVTPGGPAGLVTADDVRTFVKKGPAEVSAQEDSETPTPVTVDIPATAMSIPALPDFTRWGPVERVPFRSIRKATAKQMSLAWSQIPHVTSQDSVDITRLEAFRQKHKSEIEAIGGKLTLTVFALKAVATALKAYPNFNATLDTNAGEIIIKQYYHIGVAVNTDNGLIVPVVRDVDRKSIKELSVELSELAQRTRDRKTKLDELQGSSFTITNAGAMGGGFFTPIINYPEVAILGMGQGRLQPVVRRKNDEDYEVVPRLIMPIVLCIDHRVLDGADAIRFLRVIIDSLEDPDELLMAMI
jgi:pyruvate dehydrogenase E2 component (dihydrolipoamide acetyltransferase)